MESMALPLDHGDLESEPPEALIHSLESAHKVRPNEPQRWILLSLIKVLLCFLFSMVVASLLYRGALCYNHQHQHQRVEEYLRSVVKSDSLRGRKYNPINHATYGRFFDLQLGKQDGVNEPPLEMVNVMDRYRNQDPFVGQLHDRSVIFLTVAPGESKGIGTEKLGTKAFEVKGMQLVNTDGEIPSANGKVFQDLMMDTDLLHIQNEAGEDVIAMKSSIGDLLPGYLSIHREISNTMFTPTHANGHDAMGGPHLEMVDLMEDLYHNQDTVAVCCGDGSVIFPNVALNEPEKRGVKVELGGMQLFGSDGEKLSAYEKIFQDLMDEGLLRVHDKALCLSSRKGEELMAMRSKDLQDVVGIRGLTSGYNLVSRGGSDSIFTQMFENEKFDFVFTTLFDEVPSSDLFVAEIERVLKHGGIAAMHVSLDVWHNKFLSSKGGGVKPVTLLFHHSNMVYVARAEASGLDTIIVFKKNSLHLHGGEEDKPLASERAIIWPCMSAINTGSYLELGKFKGVSGHAHADQYLDLKDALDHVGRDLFQVAMSSSGWIRSQLSSMIGRALSGGQSDYHDRIPPANSHFMALSEKHRARDDFHALGIDPRCASELKLIVKLVETGSIHLIEKLFIMCDHPNGDAFKGNQEGIDGLSQDLWYL